MSAGTAAARATGSMSAASSVTIANEPGSLGTLSTVIGKQRRATSPT